MVCLVRFDCKSVVNCMALNNQKCNFNYINFKIGKSNVIILHLFSKKHFMKVYYFFFFFFFLTFVGY